LVEGDDQGVEDHEDIYELKWKAKVLLIRSADVLYMDARGPTSESTEEIILCIGVAITLSLSTAGQGLLSTGDILTPTAAVTMQDCSRGLFIVSDPGGSCYLESKTRRIDMVDTTNTYSESCTSIHEE